ncbi:MAG: M48 family metalloprotease, partial [Planctomycetota bacterium]
HRLAGVLVLSVIPILGAAFQAFATARLADSNFSLKTDMRFVKLSTVAHSLLWMVCSFLTVYLFQWQFVIRQQWNWGRVILLDELLIMTPALISLIGSWAVQFESQASLIPAKDRFRERFDYVMIRCRVYLFIVLAPILLILLAKDLMPYVQNISPAIGAGLSLLVMTSLLCFMPWIVRIIWKNHPMPASARKQPLLDLCHAHGLTIRDIRVWDTGLQLVNALVAGVVPRFRFLMVSDLLLETFPTHELHAILRHEAGHVRLKHLQTRIGFVLLPVLSLLAFEFDPNRTFDSLTKYCLQEVLALPVQPNLIIGLLFFGYMVAVTAWLSRKMEFEADLYAIGALMRGGKVAMPIQSHSQAMADALLRFGDQNPDQFESGSLTHPSLIERLNWIKTAKRSPEKIRQFQLIFTLQRWGLAFTFLVSTVFLISQ